MLLSLRLAAAHHRPPTPPFPNHAPRAIRSVPDSPIVHIAHLTKVYGRRKKAVTAVDDVSFSVAPGEVVGLLGPNGAGKTTTLKCLCTLIRPTSGKLEIAGEDVVAHPTRALGRIAAVLEGNRNIYWRLSPRENLEFFAGLQGIPARRVKGYIAELLDAFDLTTKANTSARMLSRGMQQKLALACALVKRTDILLLDEPTLGLDVETSVELRGALKRMAQEGSRTILLSSHDMHVVQDVCDRVIIIQHGRVVTDDRVANLLALFRARAYHFQLAERLTEEQEHRISSCFELIRFHHTDHTTEIEVELLRGEQLYQLMDLLRDTGVVVESIDRRDPNLEEIFLAILRRDQ